MVALGIKYFLCVMPHCASSLGPKKDILLCHSHPLWVGVSWKIVSVSEGLEGPKEKYSDKLEELFTLSSFLLFSCPTNRQN